MSEQTKRSPAQAWEALEGSALREGGERVAALSDKALDDSLKARGVDPKAARERGAALAAKLLAQRAAGGAAADAPAPAPAPAPEPAPGPARIVNLAAERERRGRSRITVLALVAAATLALVLGGGAIVVALRSPPPAPPPAPTGPSTLPQAPPGPPPAELARREAEDLRKLAVADCAAERWSGCAASLNRANELDPKGGEARQWQRLGGKADRGILEDSIELKPGEHRPPRTLTDAQVATLAEQVRAEGRQAQLVCAPGDEPARFCDRLAAALANAGWIVARARPAAGTPAPWGLHIEVATDADDASQASADALADALQATGILARGPDDMPPGGAGSAPLKISVGAR